MDWLLVILMRDIFEEQLSSEAMLVAFADPPPGVQVVVIREEVEVSEGRFLYKGPDRLAVLRETFERFPADRRLLLTYSHGAAFGIHCEDGPRDILWMEDLEACLPAEGIDLMLMVNCYMQTFDNGYLLRDKVRYLVAPQGVMPSMGYDYAGLLGALDLDTETLARRVVIDYWQKYLDLGMGGYIQRTTMFAVAPHFYGQAVSLFNRFLELLEFHLPHIVEELRLIRERMEVVSGSLRYDLVDAGHWVDLVVERLTWLDGVRAFGEAFGEIRVRMSVEARVGQIYLEADKASASRYGHTGLSLYYPATLARWKHQEVAWSAYRQVGSTFGRDSGWELFLDRYFQALG